MLRECVSSDGTHRPITSKERVAVRESTFSVPPKHWRIILQETAPKQVPLVHPTYVHPLRHKGVDVACGAVGQSPTAVTSEAAGVTQRQKEGS